MKRFTRATVVILLATAVKAHPQNAVYVGGCMIVDLRNSVPISDAMRNHCQSLQTGTQLPWKEPIARVTFDRAETTVCGQTGCATGKKTVRFIIENRTDINAQIVRSPTEVDIILTYAMMQVADGASRAVVDELFQLDSPQTRCDAASGAPCSMTEWLKETSAARGGKACVPGISTPGMPDGAAQNLTFGQVTEYSENLSATVLSFIFLHELAHQVKGTTCLQPNASLQQQEMSCDAFASRWLLDGQMQPYAALAWMMMVDEYIQIQDPILLKQTGVSETDSPGRGPLSYRSMFPAMNWRDRASALNTIWKNRCKNEAPDSTTEVCGNLSTLQTLIQGWMAEAQPRACISPP